MRHCIQNRYKTQGVILKEEFDSIGEFASKKTLCIIFGMETTLGFRLKQLRDAAHLTQRDLGAGVGRSQTEIWRWENDEVRIPADELPALARELHVPIVAFFDTEGPGVADVDWELQISSRVLPEEARQCLHAFLRSLLPAQPTE